MDVQHTLAKNCQEGIYIAVVSNTCPHLKIFFFLFTKEKKKKKEMKKKKKNLCALLNIL